MHNNYYFLRQFSKELTERLRGFTLVSCFSQSKDELILEWNNSQQSLFIKVLMIPGFSGLHCPEVIHRARKNSVDLFPSLIMKKVTGVRQFKNERSFAVELGENCALIFLMHGTRANVVAWENGQVTGRFRNHQEQDLSIQPDSLDREIDFSKEAFERNQDDLENFYFTWGKAVWPWVMNQGYPSADLNTKWKIIQNTLHHLEHPSYRVVATSSKVYLTLLPDQNPAENFSSAIQALNVFVPKYLSESAFLKEKAILMSALSGRLKQLSAHIRKSEDRLQILKSDLHFQQWADLIMAHIHTIKPGTEKVVLEDFTKPGTYLEIPLRKEYSPQKNAETYYRKSKNRVIEEDTLMKLLEPKRMELVRLSEMLSTAAGAEELSKVREIASQLGIKASKQEEITLPYREVEYKGFHIWIGKNATANDTLTLKHSYKEDLWLHAKDVSGSHVLIKHQSGKTFPKDVIERAASLAAWYSKRKNESLCPVAYTPKKFVRKRKGDPAGAVVVERESVIMVEPAE